MADPYSGAWKLLYDFQTLVAGVFALIAAIIAFIVGKMQISAANRRDYKQGQALAVAIWPELLFIRARYERAEKIVAGMTDFASVFQPASLQDARIGRPQFVDRFADQLFLLGEVGPPIFQLLSVATQYDQMVDTISARYAADIQGFHAHEEQQNLAGHLRSILRLLNEAEPKLKLIHDSAG